MTTKPKAMVKPLKINRLLGFTEFYWFFYRVLLADTEFNRVSQGFTGFYWVLLGFTGFYWVLLGFTCIVLGFTESY